MWQQTVLNVLRIILQVEVALPNIQFCLYVPFDQSTVFVCSKNEKIRLCSVFFFNTSERRGRFSKGSDTKRREKNDVSNPQKASALMFISFYDNLALNMSNTGCRRCDNSQPSGRIYHYLLYQKPLDGILVNISKKKKRESERAKTAGLSCNHTWNRWTVFTSVFQVHAYFCYLP